MMKLYDKALVELAGSPRPHQVQIDAVEPQVFRILGHGYLRNGKPIKSNPKAPRILLVHTRGCEIHVHD